MTSITEGQVPMKTAYDHSRKILHRKLLHSAIRLSIQMFIFGEEIYNIEFKEANIKDSNDQNPLSSDTLLESKQSTESRCTSNDSCKYQQHADCSKSGICCADASLSDLLHVKIAMDSIIDKLRWFDQKHIISMNINHVKKNELVKEKVRLQFALFKFEANFG
ncbi:hypothetical protein GJ496_006159, partial [Pomphorhynchus laevis]